MVNAFGGGLQILMTNFLLLCVGIVVALTVVGAGVLYPFDSSDKVQALTGGILGAIVLCGIVGALFHSKLNHSDSVWSRPVSNRVGTTVTNLVVGLWLCVLALLLVLMLHEKQLGTITVLLAVFFIVGLGCAWPIRSYFSRGSALPYGLGSILALFVLIAIMVGFHL